MTATRTARPFAMLEPAIDYRPPSDRSTHPNSTPASDTGRV